MTASAPGAPLFPADVLLEKDVDYSARGLKLDVIRPPEGDRVLRPAVVHLHGGGWEMYAKWPVANLFLARAGFFTVSIEYRLSGEARFPAQVHDAKTAVRWLRANAEALGVDPGRVGAWGVSAGAHLAALLGTTAGLRELEGEDGGWEGFGSGVLAVANVCGVTDFLDPEYPIDTSKLLGGTTLERPDLARLASPAAHASEASARFLHLHGARDAHVPVSQAVRLHEELQRAGASSVLEIVDGDHFINESHQAMLEARMLAFFREALSWPP